MQFHLPAAKLSDPRFSNRPFPTEASSSATRRFEYRVHPCPHNNKLSTTKVDLDAVGCTRAIFSLRARSYGHPFWPFFSGIETLTLPYLTYIRLASTDTATKPYIQLQYRVRSASADARTLQIGPDPVAGAPYRKNI